MRHAFHDRSILGSPTLLAGLLVALWAAGCDSAGPEPTDATRANATSAEATPAALPAYRVANDMLAFQDQEAFEEALAASLNEDGKGVYDDVPGFTSAIEQAREDDELDDTAPGGNWGAYLIDDPYFQALVNAEGRVMIGDEVLHVATDYAVLAKSVGDLPDPEPMAGGAESIRDLSNDLKRRGSDIEVFEDLRETPSSSDPRFSDDLSTEEIRVGVQALPSSESYVFANGRRRHIANIWRWNVWFYQSWGYENKVQHRGRRILWWGKWRSERADYLHAYVRYRSGVSFFGCSSLPLRTHTRTNYSSRGQKVRLDFQVNLGFLLPFEVWADLSMRESYGGTTYSHTSHLNRNFRCY